MEQTQVIQFVPLHPLVSNICYEATCMKRLNKKKISLKYKHFRELIHDWTQLLLTCEEQQSQRRAHLICYRCF